MTYTIREIRDSLVEPTKNPFRHEMPLYGIFEAVTRGRVAAQSPPSRYSPGSHTATGDPDWLGQLFTGPQRIKDLEQRLQKVIAHNDKLTEQLNLAQEEKRVLFDANGKLYDEARKSASKVDTMYKATNMLAELCTTLIRTLK